MNVRDVAAAYRLEQVLSASPLSTVRKAIDPGSGRLVAVKLLKPLGGAVTAAQRERFEAVMGRLTELQLAALPEVLDFGFMEDDGAFLVTSYVEGTPLTKLVGAPLERLVPILADLARGLQVLGENELVHHNLCPDNVLVVESPGGETVQLLGLGTVAYLAGETGEAPLGRSPEAERFAAPELLAPRALPHALAWRADLYSFSLLICELLRAEVSGLGSPSPRVVLPSALRDAVALQEHLAIALRRDHQARTTTFAELRRLLLARLAPETRPSVSPPAPAEPTPREPEEATVRFEMAAPPSQAPTPARPHMRLKVGQRETAEPPPTLVTPSASVPEAPSAVPPSPPTFDPHKTDPMLVVPEVPACDGAVATQPPLEVVDELLPTTALPDPGQPPAEAAPPTEPAVPHLPSAPEQPPGPAEPPHRSSTSVPAAAPPATPRRATATATAPRRRRRGLVPLLIVGGIVLATVGVLVATLVLDPGPVPLIVVPTPPSATPAPTPARVAESDHDPQVAAARDAMEDGDFETARQLLDAISPERLLALKPADAALVRGIRAELEGMNREKAIADLGHGLRTGNLRTLRAAVDALAGMGAREQAAVPGLREQLTKANEALRVSAQIARAQRSGDALELLQRSSEMIAILPSYQRAAELRQEATRTLLAEVDGHVQGRRWDRAISRLEAVVQAWPEAPEVGERLARIRHDKAVEERARRVLAQANEALAAGNPEAGLAALASLVPPTYLAAAFEETRDQLQARLAELDAQAPTIAIPASFEPRFKKNEVLMVPLRISDDYRVVSAKAYVRPEGRTAYREVQVKHLGGDEYVLELSPAVHGNTSVELYVVATDTSGHSSSLGTASKPYEIKRRRLFGS